MKFAKLLAIFGVIAVVSYCVCSSFATTFDTDRRKAYWEAAVTKEIPLGSDGVHITAWAQKHAARVDGLENQQKLYIVVEKIPVHGLICSEWDFIVDITMNGGKSVQQSIESAGTCI